MKIACSIYVENRALANIAVKPKQKYIKSTLALCRNGKAEQQFLLIHFTTQNKTGTKYKVSENVSLILTKFINEGKATIQFKQPSHDMYIKGDTIQLKGFLMLLKRALLNQISAKELTVSSLAVMPLKKKDLPPEVLDVRKRSELPMRGFPRTLKDLTIKDIGLCSVPIGIMQLQALRILNLSDNKLEFIPIDLNKIQLQDLDLSNNKLYKSTFKQWDWIGGVLKDTLVKLNLSGNKLTKAIGIVRLRRLEHLQLDQNELRKLPRDIGYMGRLRILSVAENNLSIMPATMSYLKLETLDISFNYFRETSSIPVKPSMPKTGISLLEIAGKAVLQYRLPFGPGDIPYTLVTFLENPRYCVCGKPCFSKCVKLKSIILLTRIARNIISAPTYVDHVDIKLYCCSVPCIEKGRRL